MPLFDKMIIKVTIQHSVEQLQNMYLFLPHIENSQVDHMIECTTGVHIYKKWNYRNTNVKILANKKK